MGLLELLSRLSDDEVEDAADDEEEDEVLEAELEVDLASLLEVSETGIDTEAELGSPGLGPLETSGTLLDIASSEGVAAALSTALDKSTF